MIDTKNRLGQVFVISSNMVMVEAQSFGRGFSRTSFSRDHIVSVKRFRAVYDLPFFENSIEIRTMDGRKHVVKHLRKAVAVQAEKELTE